MKHTPTWREVLTLEQLLCPTNLEAYEFKPIAIPPEVQARFDALTDEQKDRLRCEVDVMIDALYMNAGIARVSQ